MLEFCEITKIFKSDLFKKPFIALDKCSFRIPEGQIIGFLGANGAGKTTSLKIVMDFTRPSSGHVKYNHSLGRNRMEAFENIGYLPERPFFYPNLTGREFCSYMGALVDMKKKEIEVKLERWAERFKIEFALDREIKTYSKGMLQRLGFLATILHDPKLIILDEPLSGVDPIGRKDLKDIMLELNKEGKTIFFSSHIVSDVEEICDSVIFLKDGKKVFDGSVDKLIKENIKPQSDIRYMENDKHKHFVVNDEEKKYFLQKLLEDDVEIISIEQKKSTLEEIFYNVK